MESLEPPIEPLMIPLEMLTPQDLDWYIGAIEQEVSLEDRGGYPALRYPFDPERHAHEHQPRDAQNFQFVRYEPTTVYNTGGPIMDRWKISTVYNLTAGAWTATISTVKVERAASGVRLETVKTTCREHTSRLRAGMEALVAHHYGHAVEFPFDPAAKPGAPDA